MCEAANELATLGAGISPSLMQVGGGRYCEVGGHQRRNDEHSLMLCAQDILVGGAVVGAVGFTLVAGLKKEQVICDLCLGTGGSRCGLWWLGIEMCCECSRNFRWHVHSPHGKMHQAIKLRTPDIRSNKLVVARGMSTIQLIVACKHLLVPALNSAALGGFILPQRHSQACPSIGFTCNVNRHGSCLILLNVPGQRHIYRGWMAACLRMQRTAVTIRSHPSCAQLRGLRSVLLPGL